MASQLPPAVPLPLATPSPTVAPSSSLSRGHLTAEISTSMVRLLRQHSGRGPTQAKSTVYDDLVVVTLADCLTTADKQLVSAGHLGLVLQTRTALHQGMRADAIALIEELTDRKVSAYLTDQDIDPDVAVIVFILATPVTHG